MHFMRNAIFLKNIEDNRKKGSELFIDIRNVCLKTFFD